MNKTALFRYLVAYTSNFYRFKRLRLSNFRKQSSKPPYPSKYNKTYILPNEKGSVFIEQLILGEKPFALCRLGGSELGGFHQYLRIELGIDHQISDKVIYTMSNNAGFFPVNDTNLYQYGKLIQKLCSSIDVLAVYNHFMEDYVVRTYCDNPILIRPQSCSPIYSTWTRSLKGMKVLVIHPYADLIASQYKKRELLFAGEDILPEFDLCVFPAVQTSAGQRDERFSTWFDALEYMMNEISKIDFDIALIGAGAYGLPLAVQIKNELNKKAVQMGGLVQILFGIRGKRWDKSKRLMTFYNEHWVRPGAAYTPINVNKVEGGCYW